MKYAHLIVYIAAMWFAVSGAYRLRKRGRQSTKTGDRSLRIRYAFPLILSSAGTVLLALGMFRGVGLFFVEERYASMLVLATVLLFVSLGDAYASWFFPLRVQWKRSQLISPLLALALGIGAFSTAFWLRSVPGKRADAIQMAYPVKGEWKVVTGGRSRITNYHHGRPEAQNLAVDLVRHRAPSEGEPVYSPTDGYVSEAIGDRKPGGAEAEGNLIVIKKEDGTEIWLAHLQLDSVLAMEGDRVVPGQKIARCGSTGSADVPHLHIHAERDGAPVPMLFGGEKRFLTRNDIVGE